MLKIIKYIMPTFQNITQSMKKLFFSMIPNKKGRHCIAVKTLSALLTGVTTKFNGDYY